MKIYGLAYFISLKIVPFAIAFIGMIGYNYIGRKLFFVKAFTFTKMLNKESGG